MSSRRFTMRSCLIGAAWLLLAVGPAMAQRAGWGWDRLDQDSSGRASFGRAYDAHPLPAGERRDYSGINPPYRGAYYGCPYWRGYGYRPDWGQSGWWGRGPGWGLRRFAYGWPGYYGYGYDGESYAGDYEEFRPSYEEEEQEPYESEYGETWQGAGENYLANAIRAFQEGDYRTALRMAGHAEVDDPRNPNVHLIAALSMFAIGDYRGAAIQTHVLNAMGQTPNWNRVYQLYSDVRPYTRQLRALERYVKDHHSSADARFLLGFLYLTGGYRDAAKKELQAAHGLAPRDRVAIVLLRRAGGTPISETARRPSIVKEPGAAQPSPAPKTEGKSIKQQSEFPYQQPVPQGMDQEKGSKGAGRSSDFSTPQHPAPEAE